MPYPYEPERIIRDDEGKIIEQDKAGFRFKLAESMRARQNARAANEWAERTAAEVEVFCEVGSGAKSARPARA